MSEYIDELESLFIRLGSIGNAVEESMQVAVLLSSFGNKSDSPYGAVVTALQTMSDTDLNWDRATARLLQE